MPQCSPQPGRVPDLGEDHHFYKALALAARPVSAQLRLLLCQLDDTTSIPQLSTPFSRDLLVREISSLPLINAIHIQY